jgi:two-component system cell cycle sensor histidine kinase PleC
MTTTPADDKQAHAMACGLRQRPRYRAHLARLIVTWGRAAFAQNLLSIKQQQNNLTFVFLLCKLGTNANNNFYYWLKTRRRGRMTRPVRANTVSRYRELIESTPDWIWEVDANGVYTFSSGRVRDLLGYEPDEVLGRTPVDFMPPDEAKRVQALFADMVRGRAPIEHLENLNRRKDGRFVVLETNALPIVDERGDLMGYRGSNRDISERKELERALAESQTRYELATAAAHEGIWDWHVDEGTFFASERAYRMLGLEPDALDNPDKWMEMVHPDDRDAYRAAMAAHLRGENDHFSHEYRFFDASGRQRWIHQRGRALRDDASGRAYRMAGSTADITARKDAAERERRQREIIDLLNGIAAAANSADGPEEAMRICLQRVCEHTHWPIGHVYLRDPDQPQTFVPSDLWYLARPDRFAEWDRLTRECCFDEEHGLPGRVAAAAQPIWVPDVREVDWFVRADAARRLGIQTGFGLPVLGGREVMAILEFFSTDRIEPDPTLQNALEHVGVQIGRVFERDQSAQEMETARNLAEAASKAKSHFLAAMSHELRTPLNAIIGFSDVIKREVFGTLGNSRYAEYVDLIHESGDHLLQLINDILDVSAIESGKMELHEEIVTIDAVVESAVRLVRLRAEKAGIALSVDVGDGLPPIRADERRLKQALLNLLTNAVKFTPRGGQITIAVERQGNGDIAFTVADTGIGMSSGDLDKALTPFGQVHNSLTRKHDGTGLGLPLVKGLIEVHGGTMRIDSAPEAGTTVLLVLPADRVSA